MNNTIEYKGYIGSVEFSAADQVFYGKVQGIRSLISYEGSTAAELIEDFHGAVDDYLALCREEGTEPEVAYKGSLNVRLGPELHRNAAIYAMSHNYQSHDRRKAVFFLSGRIGQRGGNVCRENRPPDTLGDAVCQENRPPDTFTNAG